MKVIAKNASNKYMVLISKEEILEICFGVKNADYNKQFSRYLDHPSDETPQQRADRINLFRCGVGFPGK
jgi:hypothetical protein